MSEVAARAAGSTIPSTPVRTAAWRGLLPWLAAGLVLLAAPKLFTSGTALTMMSLMGIMVVFALAYNMLLGQTGMLSFGHAVYYGLGAFFVAHAMNLARAGGWPIPLPVFPLVGGLAGLAFGMLFGWVSTKRGGTAFAMISLGLAELVASSANVLRSFFGGEEGITVNRTRLPRFFDLNFGPQLQVYYLIAAWCLVAALLMYAITRTPLGRMCNAVRENPERVQFVGYNPRTVRFVAFCLSSLFAGIAGGLAAINFEIVNGSYVGLAQSGTVLLAAFIGGTGLFAGPIVGAIVVTWLQVMLSDLTEIWQLYFGLMFIGIVMFAPGGIAGIVAMHGPLWRRGTLPRLALPYAAAALPALAVLVGAVLAIEMAFRVLVKVSEGPRMTFAGLSLDAASAVPWLVAAALVIGGAALARPAFRRVAQAWHEAATA